MMMIERRHEILITSIVQSFSLHLMNFVGNEMFIRISCSQKKNNESAKTFIMDMSIY